MQLCCLIAFLVKTSNEDLKLGRSFRSLVDKKNLPSLDSPTRRVSFIIRRCFRINEITVTTRIHVFLKKLEASSGKLKKIYISFRNNIQIFAYTEFRR